MKRKSYPTALMLLGLWCGDVHSAPSQRAIAVDNECTVWPTNMLVHVLLQVHYPKANGREPSQLRFVYQLLCDRAVGLCSGARLQLDRIEQGKPLTSSDLDPISSAKLVQDGSELASIEWNGKTFAIAFVGDKCTVRYTDQDGRAEATGSLTRARS